MTQNYKKRNVTLEVRLNLISLQDTQPEEVYQRFNKLTDCAA